MNNSNYDEIYNEIVGYKRFNVFKSKIFGFFTIFIMTFAAFLYQMGAEHKKTMIRYNHSLEANTFLQAEKIIDLDSIQNDLAKKITVSFLVKGDRDALIYYFLNSWRLEDYNIDSKDIENLYLDRFLNLANELPIDKKNGEIFNTAASYLDSTLNQRGDARKMYIKAWHSGVKSAASDLSSSYEYNDTLQSHLWGLLAKSNLYDKVPNQLTISEISKLETL